MAKDVNINIEEILERASQYLADEDLVFIQRAYEFSKDAHADQYRKSGEAYIIHPVQVAGILVELEMDPETIAGGLLHDVVEDTEETIETIEEACNPEVAMLVDGVTKLCRSKCKSKGGLQAEHK